MWFLLACTDYGFSPKDTPAGPAEETAGSGVPDTDNDTSPPTSETGAGPCSLDLPGPSSVPVDEACAGGPYVPPGDPWNIVVEWETAIPGGSLCMPLTARFVDTNKDGRVDEADDVAVVVASTVGVAHVLSGTTGAPLFQANGFRSDGCPVLSDLDRDGTPEIAGPGAFGTTIAFDGAGNRLYYFAANQVSGFPVGTAADISGSGAPHLILDSYLFDGATGEPDLVLSPSEDYWRSPVVADIDLDGVAEVLIGDGVFSADGSVRFRIPGTGYAVFTAVVNLDDDAFAEIVALRDGIAWFYEHDGTLRAEVPLPGGGVTVGPPCAADADGDGSVEIGAPAGGAFVVLDEEGNVRFSAPATDTSGSAGCSAFDFNGDGSAEFVYADEDTLRIFSGEGAVLFLEDDGYDSRTGFDYPVIADVDGDGSAELLAVDSGSFFGVRAYGHATNQWPPTGWSWSIHDFAVTNQGLNGEVPSAPTPSWLADNLFRSRPITGGSGARVDLAPTIHDVCVETCDAGGATVSVSVANYGGAAVNLGVRWVLQGDASGVRVDLAEGTLPVIGSGAQIAAFEIAFDPRLAPDGLWFSVDASDALLATECDASNNEAAYLEPSGC